jgi:hypothetical protein
MMGILEKENERGGVRRPPLAVGAHLGLRR